MATTLAKPAGTGNGSGGRGFSGGGGGDGVPFHRPAVFDTASLGMMLGLAAVSMLFIAFTSAYVVREGFDPGWRPIRMPALLPWNTAILVVSSIVMEKARRAESAGAAGRWLAATWACGTGFLAGQLVVWRQLAAGGIYIGTNPHSSFFFLLTAAHGAHILGGVAAVGWLALRRPGDLLRLTRIAAIYWHFMDALWVYLVVLLFAWR